MRAADRSGPARSIKKTRVCLHGNADGSWPKMPLCLHDSSLPPGQHQLGLSRPSSRGGVWKLVSTFRPTRSESSALFLQPQLRAGGVCLSVFFFVNSVWQVVAWDTCSGIKLQGVLVH